MTDRSLREVHGLEDEAHDGRHLDHFAAHQTQLLVVVQHRVHVLDPHGVDRPVEHDPLAVGAAPWRVALSRDRPRRRRRRRRRGCIGAGCAPLCQLLG